jgi:hypothetical protein
MATKDSQLITQVSSEKFSTLVGKVIGFLKGSSPQSQILGFPSKKCFRKKWRQSHKTFLTYSLFSKGRPVLL